MVVSKPALLLHTPGLIVAYIMPTPELLEIHILKPVPHDFSDGFRSQPLTPIRYADPISDLTLVVRNPQRTCFADMQSNTADWLPSFPKNDGILLRGGKNIDNHLATVLHTGMRSPTRTRPNIRMLRIFIKIRGVADFPGPKNQTLRLKYHDHHPFSTCCTQDQINMQPTTSCIMRINSWHASNSISKRVSDSNRRSHHRVTTGQDGRPVDSGNNSMHITHIV